MTILVDMDDTMEQLLKRWVARANEKYGQDITLDFIARIRDERRFSSLEDLQSQLRADCALIAR